MNPISEKSAASRNFEKICAILEKYNNNPNRLITILQEVQEEYRYLPEEVLSFISVSLGIPPAQVFGVATFYAHFALEPKGKYVIKVCDGTACHVRNSTPIIEAIQERLRLDKDQKTTADMLFTLETVSCLGACGLAPVIMVNDNVYSQMNPQKINSVIDNLLKLEEETYEPANG